MSQFKVTKAVIPVAGLGTRFLPATKAMPKEMLPLIDKPVIQYVVEEAVSAGLQDVLMVTGRNKNTLENHFDRVAELEANLERKGDHDRLAKVMASTDEHSFALLLGDDVMDARDPLLTKMLELHESTGENVIALMEVDPSQIHLYGCAVTQGEVVDGVVRVTSLVEKPKTEEAPSNLAIIGRYVLRPEIFDILEETAPGRGGEIQLTDALMTAAQNPDRAGGVLGVVFKGRRYDTGDKLDFIKATLRIAVDREDIGQDLRQWLHEFNNEI
ncbi:MAG: UTP--glucose-1-phosphate uridylyltransferase [Micrococcales bacterium]|nr:UTP--glucose-1-phosphate uridylyltransferase [Micrococcales bacterium]